MKTMTGLMTGMPSGTETQPSMVGTMMVNEAHSAWQTVTSFYLRHTIFNLYTLSHKHGDVKHDRHFLP